MKNWNGIMKILQIEHVRNGEVIWQSKNLYNLLHLLGEQFLLSILFNGTALPSQWYFGLDNRTTPDAADTMESLTGEPSSNGYVRQSVPANSFVVALGTSVYKATSPIVTFTAASGSWGPVSNLFLTDQAGNSGTLVATAPLGQPVTVNSGDAVRMRMAFQLRDDTPSS